MIDPETTTVKEAQAYLRPLIRSGCICPCCNSRLKLYKRKLNAGMARILIFFYRSSTPGSGWVHISKLFLEFKKNAASNEYSKLRFWGLLEPNSKRQGEWRITPLGRDFVEGKTNVKSHIHLYDNRFFGFTGTEIDIHWCLGEPFDFQELMKGG